LLIKSSHTFLLLFPLVLQLPTLCSCRRRHALRLLGRNSYSHCKNAWCKRCGNRWLSPGYTESAGTTLAHIQPGQVCTGFWGLKMFENKLAQTKLASEIGIGQSKVSEILSGKRKPDLPFLKGVHKVLKIDASFLLEHV